MTTYNLNEDERALVQRALGAYLKAQHQKFYRLQKSAGGRNWRSNEEQQRNVAHERDALHQLRERLAAEYRSQL